MSDDVNDPSRNQYGGNGHFNGRLRQLSTKLRFSLELKVEQRETLNSLLDGSDVLAVLPTGYEKSLIFRASSSSCWYLKEDIEKETSRSSFDLSPEKHNR